MLMRISDKIVCYPYKNGLGRFSVKKPQNIFKREVVHEWEKTTRLSARSSLVANHSMVGQALLNYTSVNICSDL